MTNLKQQEYPGLMQKQVEVDGVKYTLQRIPFKFYMELNDRFMGRNGALQQTPFSEELLKHVVVAPKVTLTAFEFNYAAGMQLLQEIESFLKSKADKTADAEDAKE